MSRFCSNMRSLTATSLNAITSKIIGSAINIHRTFGPGLFESAYVSCLTHDLRGAGLSVATQRSLPLVYGTLRVPCAYRADLIVEDQVLVETKALETVSRIHLRQLNTYVCLGDYRVGLLLNFGALTMKEGIYRVVNRFPDH